MNQKVERFLESKLNNNKGIEIHNPELYISDGDGNGELSDKANNKIEVVYDKIGYIIDVDAVVKNKRKLDQSLPYFNNTANNIASTVVKLQDCSLAYGSKKIIDNLTFEINNRDKIALVGQNRSGKSSLIKLIAKIIEPDSGSVIEKNGTHVVYVDQEITLLQNNDSEDTIFDNVLQSNNKINDIISTAFGHTFDSLSSEKQDNVTMLTGIINDNNLKIIEKIYLRTLELCDFFNINIAKKIKTCSGGELKKVQLIGSLLYPSDLILFDEPTNHLDIYAVSQLTTILNNTKVAAICISHDRQFLDDITNEYWEIWDKKIYKHTNCNYNNYLANRESRLGNDAVVDNKRDAYIKREYKWVAAGVKARGVKDKGRMDRYQDTVAVDKAKVLDKVECVIPDPEHLGTRIVDIESLSINIEMVNLVDKFNFRIGKRDRIGIVGNNGSGKSTFIDTILSQMEGVSIESHANITQGTVKWGSNTKPLYLDQYKKLENNDVSVFDFISEGKERLDFGNGSISTYKYLKNWLFGNDQYRQPIRSLSGGERARLVLAKKLLKPANLLIFDEPTNDLDVDTIELLEESLGNYKAPVVIISHDRRFLDNVCNVIFKFDPSSPHPIISYGNYTDYCNKYEKKIVDILPQLDVATIKPIVENNGNVNPKLIRANKARKREIEKKIQSLETTISKINIFLLDPTNYDQENSGSLIAKIQQEYNRLELKKKELDSLYEEFFTLE